jgi:hypothetical protein
MNTVMAGPNLNRDKGTSGLFNVSRASNVRRLRSQ